MMTGWMFFWGIVQLGLMAFGGWVLFMFYSRLAEIAEEMRKLRIAYEFAEQRRNRSRREDGDGGPGASKITERV